MQAYDFHIHGKPYSQDIWKNDTYYDYLKSIYSNAYLNASTDESYMIIEILNNTVHYTYMRSKNIRDNVEREGSFFAITVSFKSQYCSVAILYDLLDQIYNKIAKPSFFASSKSPGCLKYKVLQLEDGNVADQMRIAFDKYVMHLNLKNLANLNNTIHSNGTKIVSLKDVDSPEFLDMLMRNRIVVSSELDSAIKRCEIIETDLITVRSQKETLASTNEQLQAKIIDLSKKNETLSDQLNASTSSAEKKYKNKLDLLENDLTNITRERDSLKQKIDKAKSSIELIDKPFQTLTRLLAGRFPENSSSRRYDSMEEEPESSGKNQKSVWSTRLNSILLGLILACCCTILFVVLKAEVGNSITPAEENIVVESVEKDAVQLEPDEKVIAEIDPADSSYDSWEYCILNIKGGGDNLELNKEYTLSVTKKNGKPANIPQGSWSVYINKDEPINKNNSFIITDPVYHGKNIMIEYIVNDKPVKQRVCKIQ